MENKLFTKQFLNELQEKTEGVDLVDFVMYSKAVNFHDAVLEIAEYYGMRPEYLKKSEAGHFDTAFMIKDTM